MARSDQSVVPTISLVIPTIGRPTLAKTLQSLEGQDWRAGDEIVLVGDGHFPASEAMARQFTADLPLLRYVENPGPRGFWGHCARNWLYDTGGLNGTHVAALDDDDEYPPGTIATIRKSLEYAPHHPHIFRMRYADGRELWADREVRHTNVGTPMLVCPNDKNRLARFALNYGGDFGFIRDTCAFYRDGPFWWEEVICLVRPPARTASS